VGDARHGPGVPRVMVAFPRCRARRRARRQPRRGLRSSAVRPRPGRARKSRSSLVRLGGHPRRRPPEPPARPAIRRSGFSDALCASGHSHWRHGAWLEDGILLREAGKLAGIPGVLVHGRLDVSGPPDIARHLAQAWPDCELVLVDEAGHGCGEPGMSEALIGATDRFGTRR